VSGRTAQAKRRYVGLNNKRLATISARQSGDVAEKPVETGDLEAMTLEELETNAAAHRKVYETFLQAYMTTVQDQSFPIPNARLISRAEPPVLQDGHPSHSGTLNSFRLLP
jgi:succinoglycan biosynthesis transport protein ExoP